MLSILLPVYETEVRDLVRDLHRQAQAWGGVFEILVMDDASPGDCAVRNAELSALPGVRYEVLPHNLGRARIRNRLAAQARYDYLLFIDADTALADDRFIERYAQALSPDRLLYGGWLYASEPPDDPRRRLRWLYGSRREQSTAEQRNRQPHKGFMTNNFVIPKALFLPFDEDFKGYGHEDTLFGWELYRLGIPILHLDNPVLHLGLETAERFLDKTRQSLHNLLRIYRQHPELPEDWVRLMRYFARLRRWRLLWAVLGFFWLFEGLITGGLRSGKPRLFWFDVYKLAWLTRISRCPDGDKAE